MSRKASDKVLFKRAPLRQVIAQIRYPLLPRFGEAGFVAPFIEGLEESYPEVNRQVQRTAIFSTGEGVSVGAPETIWRMGTHDQASAVVLAESALTLEVSQYRDIEDLVARFAVLLDAAVAHLGVKKRTRLGLRYINEFRREGVKTLEEWSSLLQEDFLSSELARRLGGSVDRMMQEVRVVRSDGIFAVRHGLVPPASNGATEGVADAAASHSAYLLDLDYYDETEVVLDTQQTIEQLRAYSEFTYGLFRWTLKEELYRLLEPEDDGR